MSFTPTHIRREEIAVMAVTGYHTKSNEIVFADDSMGNPSPECIVLMLHRFNHSWSVCNLRSLLHTGYKPMGKHSDHTVLRWRHGQFDANYFRETPVRVERILGVDDDEIRTDVMTWELTSNTVRHIGAGPGMYLVVDKSPSYSCVSKEVLGAQFTPLQVDKPIANKPLQALRDLGPVPLVGTTTVTERIRGKVASDVVADDTGPAESKDCRNTVFEWFSKLPDAYRRLALANLQTDYHGTHRCNSMAEALDWMVSWNATPQGHPFWEQVAGHYSTNGITPLPLPPGVSSPVEGSPPEDKTAEAADTAFRELREAINKLERVITDLL